jgi:hypothetical protein
VKVAFSFFLRLFVCFVAAKFLVQAVDLDARSYLVALTVVLLINVYLLDYLVFRDRRSGQESPPETPPEEPRR